MIFHRYSVVALLALVLIGAFTFRQAAMGQERTIQIDLGLDTQTTAGTGWNNFGGAAGATPTAALNNLKDSTGALTGIALTPTWSSVSSNAAVSGTAANYDGTYPAALAGIPGSALRDSVYVRDGETLTFSLTNLVANRGYNFMFYGASGNTGDFSLFTVTGANVKTGAVVPIVNNSTQVANITGIVPDATQKISILFEGRRPDGTTQNPSIAGDALGRWNYLGITQFRLGDYNNDNAVNTLDYDAWRSSFDTTATAADGNGNGVVDAADYVVWRKAMGPGSGAFLSTQGVPEPSAVAMLIAAAIGLWGIGARPARRMAQQ